MKKKQVEKFDVNIQKSFKYLGIKSPKNLEWLKEDNFNKLKQEM